MPLEVKGLPLVDFCLHKEGFNRNFTQTSIIMKQIIRNHFKLQHLRFERASIEFGLAPIVSYVLITIIFSLLSILLLSRSIIEHWEYVILAFIILFLFSNPDRLRFYKNIYSKEIFVRIRWIENLLIVLPFLFFLFLFKAFIPVLPLLVLTAIASSTNRNIISSFTLPTPFYKYPFEFASGFRMSWLLIIILYVIFSIAAYVDNYYLGLFVLLSTALCSTFYYQTQERLYYIWIHKMDSISFIIHKIKIAIGYTFLTCFPLLISAIIIWPTMTIWIILLFLCSLLFISTLITAKYAMYPQIFNLPITIVLSIGFAAPPALLLLFPYFLKRASKNLKNILS